MCQLPAARDSGTQRQSSARTDHCNLHLSSYSKGGRTVVAHHAWALPCPASPSVRAMWAPGEDWAGLTLSLGIEP